MKIRTVLLLMVGLLFSMSYGLLLQASAADDKTPALNGTWVCERIWEGSRGDWDSTTDITMKFNGSHVECMEGGNMILDGVFTIRHDTEPQEIDLVFTVEGEQIQIPGIFSVSNSVLTLCHPSDQDGDRPINFEPTKDVSIAVCNKVKKAKAEAKDIKKKK